MTAHRPPVRPAAVRRKVEAWLAEGDDAVAIALTARPEWTGDPVLTVGGTAVRVVPCPTPIAARAALSDRADAERLVLLTDLTEQELGDGLLAHLSRQRTRSVDSWDLVRQAFGNQAGLDLTLVRTGKWVADALTELAPLHGWPPPAGTVLTREHALRHLAGTLLDLEPDELDSAGLLQWSTNASAQLRFLDLPADWAAGISAFLVEVAGPAAVAVMAAVRARQGIDAVPLGLLAGVLWPRGAETRPDVEIAVARTRLEPRFGGVRLTAAQAAAFLDAAEAWTYRALDGERAARVEAHRMLHRAEEIAAEIDIGDRLAASALLPSGLTQRMRAFAHAVRLALPATPTATPAAGLVGRAQSLLAGVEEHRAADRRQVETARMAVRLLRWLANPDGPAPATLLDAVHRQVRDDAWVDRARLDIFAGEADRQVAEVYHLLYRAVDARRARHDEQFARLLQDATAAEREPGALLRVEDVLDRVIQPILDNGRRILLLVLDGMSTAASAEIADSVARNTSWLELTPGGHARTGVLAALPTVTEVSRCSLFSGRIAAGDQTAELKAFTARFPGGVLLHKAGLRASAGAAVDPRVAEALDDPAIPVVAAVINTIDDALDRSDPGTIEWSTETINGLRDLLSLAHDRVVVLVSDHGHVVDRGPDAVTRPADTSENRWRPAAAAGRAGGSGEPGSKAGPAGEGESVGEGELVFAGSRVALGGGQVVLPWREEFRYGPRKAGYHGGAAPAEAVIPLLIFSADDDNAVPGWAGAPVASPEWWREPLPEVGTGRAAEPARGESRAGAGAGRPAKRAKPSVQDESLFDLPATPPPPSSDPVSPPPDPVSPPPASASPPPASAARPPASAARPPASAAPPPASAARPATPAAPSGGASGGAGDLVAALLGSPIYAERRDSRAPLPDDRVAALIGALIANGGRATLDTLATRANIPAHRIQPTITALRRLLQVEGYPVLTLDADGRTAKLDVTLLAEQFGLESP